MKRMFVHDRATIAMEFVEEIEHDTTTFGVAIASGLIGQDT